MAESEKLTDLIKESLASIKEMLNCETVMGEAINTISGTTIIPVSKISLGYGSGGLDYFSKNAANASKEEKISKNNPNFAGAGGLGLSVVPLGFLVIDKEGRCEFLSISASENIPTVVNIINSAVDIIERTPEIVEKLKNIFSKNNNTCECQKTNASDDKSGLGCQSRKDQTPDNE